MTTQRSIIRIKQAIGGKKDFQNENEILIQVVGPDIMLRRRLALSRGVKSSPCTVARMIVNLQSKTMILDIQDWELSIDTSPSPPPSGSTSVAAESIKLLEMSLGSIDRRR